MLWGAISRAVRTPSRFDRDIAEPASPAILEGSPTFVSEDLIAYEIGYRAKLGPKFTTSVFYVLQRLYKFAKHQRDPRHIGAPFPMQTIH